MFGEDRKFLAQARDGVMADGEVACDLTRALSGGHALCCQLALVLGQVAVDALCPTFLRQRPARFRIQQREAVRPLRN